MPASFYLPSTRDYPTELPELTYPPHTLLRRVRPDGTMKLLKQTVHVGEALVDQVVGLEELDNELWRLHFGPMVLAVIDGRRGGQFKLLPIPR